MSFLERLNALIWFLLAAAWFLFSDLIAQHAAEGLDSGDFQEPLYRIFLLFLLIVGYWVMSRLGQRRMISAKATALAPRPGWGREFALGAALGWAGVLACILPVALIGGLVITVFTNAHQWLVLLLDLIALAAGTLAIEVAFRGYAFLRLVEAMGPVLGAFFMAAVYAIWRTHAAPTTTAAVLVSFFLGLVLAIAVLRTRALWVSWGFHFAWLASMSVLFGLPVSGSMNYSPILVTNARGPAWISGGGEGPEGCAFAVLVSFLLMFFMARFTSELKHKYGYPEIVPGGMPVDIDAAARAQHEAAMGAAEPQQPPLVQIQPAQPVAANSENPFVAETVTSAEPNAVEAPAPDFDATPPRETEPEPPPPNTDSQDSKL
ncbi:MAG TPA: type II CAAX endopeptidase family protein [Acidobacteriaceae bacterium]|nr:type II CAAX endopeptidase family protein [Acidobacteriaceae bacterium]